MNAVTGPRISSASAGPWAAKLPIASAGAAAALRLVPDLMVRIDDAGDLWLRGAELTNSLELELRKLPAAERFAISFGDAGDVITPFGKRIPCGTLPNRGWTPIADWCRPSMPPPALPGRLPKSALLSLERSNQAADTSVLLTTLDDWTAWAVNAPQVRLKRLAFAASSDGRVIVRGSPLPPIAGIQYVERQGVAVPAGWELRPAVDPATVHALLLMSATDLAIFSEDGSWERIDADQFTAATRSAARATSAAAVPSSGAR